MTIKLFWFPRTRASRAVWLLEEAGIDYERIEVDLNLPWNERSQEFLRASPMGKVPAIADGDVMLSESAAISLYIADKYPKARLAPPIDSPLRGRYLYWVLFTPSIIDPAGAEVLAGTKPNRGRNGWGDFNTMYSILDAALADGPWLLGERFSAADVMVGSAVLLMLRYEMSPRSPALLKYADRCGERLAYRKAVSFDAQY